MPGTVYFFPPKGALPQAAALAEKSKLSPEFRHGDECRQDALQRFPVPLDRQIPVHRSVFPFRLFELKGGLCGSVGGGG